MDFLTSNFIIWKMETEIKEKDININIHIIIQNLTNVKHHLTNDVEKLTFPISQWFFCAACIRQHINSYKNDRIDHGTCNRSKKGKFSKDDLPTLSKGIKNSCCF